jgi:hypothetical protein
MNRPHAARLLVLALASSAGVHAALTPTHAAESPLLGAMFALSALALVGVALGVDRRAGPAALTAAAVLLCSLVAVYAATRLVALPPLTHTEPVDALGAATKLVEAAGLLLALRLLHTPAGSARRSPRYEKELAHEQ